MKNDRWSGSVGLLLLGSLALAGDRPVDLSGTWVLEKTEQSFSPMVAGYEPGVGGYPEGGSGMGAGLPGPGSRGGHPGGQMPGVGGYPGGEGRVPGAAIPGEAGDLNVAIHQTSTELKLVRKWHQEGKEQTVLQTFPLDGSESSNRDDLGRGEWNAKARWRKGSLIIEGSQRLDTGKREVDMPVKAEFSLSKDGKSLIVKTTRQTPRGMMGTKQTFKRS